jgi:hypothetical protein
MPAVDSVTNARFPLSCRSILLSLKNVARKIRVDVLWRGCCCKDRLVMVEETGYEAAELEKVCECYIMPGSSDEIIGVFFARKLLKREQSLDIGEVIDEVRSVRLAEVNTMIERGEIRDAKTLVGLFHALRRSVAEN